MAEPSRSKGRWMLALIAAVFLAPLVAAYLWIYLGHPAGNTMNYGTLIQPPQPVKKFTMTDLEGNRAGIEVLHGKWTLLYVGSGPCLAQCRHNLYKIERVRLAQGENVQRVQSLYLAPQTVEGRVVADTLVQYRGLRGYRISREELAAMAPGISAGEGKGPESERIYVVDPLGNLMMFYSPDADPSGMSRDLERLLRASHIG